MLNSSPFHITLGQQFLRDIWFSKANSTQAADTDYLFLFILWVCIVSFIILMGAMFWFIIRYRRRPGVPTIRSASHNTALELGWSVGPLLILVPIFFWGLKGYVSKQAAPAGVEIINVRGYQWNWTVQYSNGASPQELKLSPSGDQKVPVIVVPEGRPVKLIFTSNDVLHAFYIPDFRTKIDVIPNRYTSMWFKTLKATEEAPGPDGKVVYKDHPVFCAEYCGNNHSDMAAFIRVLPPKEYERVKADWTEPKGKPTEIGKKLWEQYCKSCHNIDGKAGGTGPTWKNLWGRTEEFSNNPPITFNDHEAFLNYVRESVYSPGAKLVKGFGPNMNSFQGIIKEKFIVDIVAFMQSAEVSPDAPEEIRPKPEGAAEGDAKPEEKKQ
ncbi:MAG: cytochrome c oxidase subunit II transmembrane domain-containing protein [Phycisphaerales bacterium]